MTIRAFIFDLDGVITDTAELHYAAWKRLADEVGLPFSRADNEHLRGLSRRASLERILGARADNIDEDTMAAWMARKNGYYVESLASLTPDDVLPGVGAFLAEARALGIGLGLGSASKNARQVLESLGLLDSFDVIGDGYSVVHTKPAPDLFIWVAGGMGVCPVDAAVFEDAEAGIEAAIKGGFYAVGIGSANVSAADLVIGGLDATTPVAITARLAADRRMRA